MDQQLFNLARVYEMLGMRARAADYYIEYVRASRELSTDRRRMVADALLRTLE